MLIDETLLKQAASCPTALAHEQIPITGTEQNVGNICPQDCCSLGSRCGGVPSAPRKEVFNVRASQLEGGEQLAPTRQLQGIRRGRTDLLRPSGAAQFASLSIIVGATHRVSARQR